MSVTFVIDPYPPVTVPQQATASLSSFREWAGDEELPENIQLLYYRGEVWVDMARQQIFTHVAVKTEITRVLASLVKANKLGIYLVDGALVTNEEAELSANPDAVFVAHNALTAERVTLVEGKEHGFVEIVGSPDMALEVVSDSSERKDTRILFEAYYKAGIREYWLVDAAVPTSIFVSIKGDPVVTWRRVNNRAG